MVVLIQNFSELLGYTSIACWLGAQFPQILENIKRQSCESLALPFLLNWMLGDASNLIGCLLTHQLPFQTYLATYFCTLDCFILCQYFYYGSRYRTRPVGYAHPRSRAASSAGRLSVDASHYRTLSVAAGNIATAAALAAFPDAHTEYRNPREHGEERQSSDHASTLRASEEIQDGVNDTVHSPLSDSLHSESGRRKRVSWSQERRDRQPSSSSVGRPQRSPVLPPLNSAAAAAALARGRPLQREAEVEEIAEEQEQTDRRAGSRASRRSAGMVLLGMWALFGVGRYAGGGARPLLGRGGGVGVVLLNPASDLSTAAGPPVAYDPSIHSHHSFVRVEMPPLPDAGFNRQRQADNEPSYDRIIGRIFAWICTVLYLTSRLPQIWKNYVRKSVEGLSMYLFIFAFLGNFFYVLSILTSAEAHRPPPESTEFFRESIPYLLGSGGTFFFDFTIVTQSLIYKGKHPRRGHIRSRGASLVRSASLAEETAGLLRGDALAESRAPAIMDTTTTSSGHQLGRATSNAANNQSLFEPRADHLRKLVLDYLCHNCYIKTAQAFARDSAAVRHLDKDGGEIRYETTCQVGDEMSGVEADGLAPDLSESMIREILLRERIRTQILLGKVEEAIVLLNQHFPKVLAEDAAYDTTDADVEMEISDEDANPDRLEYTTETVNPDHLSLNLRIHSFIEACRTVPLVYVPPNRSTGDLMSEDLDNTVAPPSKCDTRGEDNYQGALLIRAQKLYATVNGLRKQEDRATYLKELSNVGGLLAYKVPENSPMLKYLHQERRNRVAEQINSAILHSTNMPTVSHLELAVRYTHCLWAALNEHGVKIPANSRRPSGVALPPSAKTQSTSASEKEPSYEVSGCVFSSVKPMLNPWQAPRFDLQLFLDTRT
ncbi:CTLH/CRA C-terminal to lish motif domain-containing protein [Melanogaster broomeanus]|nr:CTLH/CRA C-terminal to lish motif domain-containing protein [Melanogaster broomeanus]